MKKLLRQFKSPDQNYFSVICLIIIWKVLLLFTLIYSFKYIPLFSPNLLGGGIQNYMARFYIFPWANFDGEHFIAIAQFGYQQYTQAFFPLYPKLISLFINGASDPISSAAINGLFISTVSLTVALIYLYKLIKLDYSSKFSLGVILILLVFPASFYFNAVYSESLFLMLVVLSFYFFRTKSFFWAFIFGYLACLTRVFGILIFFSFLIEIFIYKIPFKKSFWVFLIPLGLLTYMTYLYFSIGDPLAFYNLQLIVGEQHQRGIVLTPQILYRYWKIIIDNHELSPFFTTVLFELATGVVFFLLPLIGLVKKVRLSYIFFAFFGYLLPTIQGSFSSLPRYVLILFPSFMILGLLVQKLPLPLKIGLGIMSILLLIIETSLFLRGYWVA